MGKPARTASTGGSKSEKARAAARERERARARRARSQSRLLPIPEECREHLQFLLWPKEKVLYQEKPRAAAVVRRSMPLLSVLLLAALLLPALSVALLGMLFYNGAPLYASLSPLLLLVPAAALLPLAGAWYRSMRYCFVLTERRVILFRPRASPCAADMRADEQDVQDFADDRGFSIAKYADGTGSLLIPLARVPHIASVQRFEAAVKQVLSGRPMYTVHERALSPLLLWARRVGVALLVPALLLLIVPAIVSMALEAAYEAEHASDAASADSRGHARLWWIPPPLFYAVFGSLYALCTAVCLAVVVWATRGYKGSWTMQNRTENEMGDAGAGFEADALDEAESGGAADADGGGERDMAAAEEEEEELAAARAGSFSLRDPALVQDLCADDEDGFWD